VSESFREFERRGWENAAPTYARAFTDVTGGTLDALLAAGRVERGARVLDVAAGPGIVARAARAKGARTVGVDFSPRMAALASAVTDVVVGDVDRSPFANGVFDAALCNFGLLHFAHPERAAAEIARVLRAGGRAALTVWAPPAENVFFGAMYRALEKHAPRKPEIPASAPFFHFADAKNATALLEAAGLREARVETVSWRARVASAEGMVALFAEGSVRTAAILKAQDAAAVARITDSIAAEVAAHAGSLPIAAVLISGVKP
jgi:ubiquinone/menaquinone biosynthesis C-methylase UbiE